MRDFTIDLVWAKLQMAISAVGGVLGYFLGGLDGMLITLIIFTVLDYATGLMCAVVDKKLSSSVGFRGICKKVLIFMLVGVAHIVDLHVICSGNALRSAVVCFYLSNEGVSLLENAAHLGLPIPEKLKAILIQLHSRSDEVNETIKGYDPAVVQGGLAPIVPLVAAENEINPDQSGEEHLPEVSE